MLVYTYAQKTKLKQIYEKKGDVPNKHFDILNVAVS